MSRYDSRLPAELQNRCGGGGAGSGGWWGRCRVIGQVRRRGGCRYDSRPLAELQDRWRQALSIHPPCVKVNLCLCAALPRSALTRGRGQRNRGRDAAIAAALSSIELL